MIDEEDDEEILKKHTSFKKVLKNIALIALIIVGVLFIYLGGQDSTFNFFIGFSLICFMELNFKHIVPGKKLSQG
jgi:hypothetical protein